MKSLVTCVLLTGTLCLAGSPLLAEIRWDASFSESYRSEAEGAEVAFAVQTPPRVDELDAYPLVVVLNGGLRVPPSSKFPYFRAQPSRGRIWGYRTISAYDAMRVIGHMKEHYPIDSDRVYLVGSSAGGSGAMHLASCYPDEFAAVLPLVAAGNNYPLLNFTNLPVAFHHGDRDWVSSICNARVQAQRMRALGCPTVLHEYASGHSVPGSHEPLMAWLFEQRRNPAPATIRHQCEVPSLGRSYWLRIEELDDPHQRATVEAEVREGVVSIRAENAAALSLDLTRVGELKGVRFGREPQLPVSPTYRRRGGRWRPGASADEADLRVYEAGGAANLYQGEPLVIVYGSRGDRAGALRAAAEKLASYGGPWHTTLATHRFPVVADTELSEQQQSRCNLILVGRPSENRVTESMMPLLPLAIEEDVLAVADRPPLGLDGRVLGLLHPNPRHPGRLAYIVAPFGDSAMAGFAGQPQRYLAGADGFDRVSQPDLVVHDRQRRVSRQMQFGKDWQWLKPAGAETPISPRFADRAELAVACMRLMRSKSDADYALWWGPADRGMWGSDFNHLQSFDPEVYTLADFRTQHRVSETTLGTVTGVELKEIWERWGRTGELLSVPEIELDSVRDQAEYRIHIPMDMYIKLGQRQRNLADPAPGPPFAAEELIPAIFKRPAEAEPR